MAGNQYADGRVLAAPRHAALRDPRTKDAPRGQRDTHGCHQHCGAPRAALGSPKSQPCVPGDTGAQLVRLATSSEGTAASCGSCGWGGGCARLEANCFQGWEHGEDKTIPWLQRLESDAFISRADIWILSAPGLFQVSHRQRWVLSAGCRCLRALSPAVSPRVPSIWGVGEEALCCPGSEHIPGVQLMPLGGKKP